MSQHLWLFVIGGGVAAVIVGGWIWLWRQILPDVMDEVNAREHRNK